MRISTKQAVLLGSEVAASWSRCAVVLKLRGRQKTPEVLCAWSSWERDNNKVVITQHIES